MRLLALLVLGSLFACGGREPAAPAAAATEASAEPDPAVATAGDEAAAEAERRFRPNMRQKPCELLTAAMVSELAGVAPETFLVSNPMTDMCRYDWDGGRASVGFIRVSRDAQTARRHFDVAYRSAGHDKKSFERVDGVGDAAVWEQTKPRAKQDGDLVATYPNELKVRVSNMIFTVSRTDAKGSKPYREDTIALAKLVVEKLPG